jgi:hypothetical protein
MKSPVRHMTMTYILSLSFIALLSILIYVELDEIISIQVSSAETINVSGRQRMLLQRTNLLAYDFVVTGSRESQALAADAFTLMQANHKFLLAPHYIALALGEPSPLSAELQAMYFAPPLKVEAKMDAYEAALINIINIDAAEHLSSIDEFKLLDLGREPLHSPSQMVILMSLDR